MILIVVSILLLQAYARVTTAVVHVIWRLWYHVYDGRHTIRVAVAVTSVLYRGGINFMVYTGSRDVVKEAMVWRKV